MPLVLECFGTILTALFLFVFKCSNPWGVYILHNAHSQATSEKSAKEKEKVALETLSPPLSGSTGATSGA